MVLLHDALNGIEAEAGALAHFFGGEEGLENVLLDLGRNSRAIVGDLHYCALVIAIGADQKLSLATHGVDGVVDDVGPDLIELAAE